MAHHIALGVCKVGSIAGNGASCTAIRVHLPRHFRLGRSLLELQLAKLELAILSCSLKAEILVSIRVTLDTVFLRLRVSCRQLVRAAVFSSGNRRPFIGLVQFRLDGPRCRIAVFIIIRIIGRPEDILLGDESAGVVELHPGVSVAQVVLRACVAVHQTAIVIR